MIFGITVIPLGAGESIASPVTEVVQGMEDAGLNYQVNSACTVVEGAWEQVMPVLREAECALRDKYHRVFMVIMVDDHLGKTNRLQRAADDVEKRLEHAIPLS